MGLHPKRVAVIGAGVSGLTSARHLSESGLEVVVFERYRSPGGNWVYDERAPLEPSYPAESPSTADFVSEQSVKARIPTEKLINGLARIEEDELRFAPPSPAYSSLTNNISTKLQQLKDFPWKAGTTDYINVRQKQEYLESYSHHFNIEPLIRYNTRVEALQKTGDKWKVTSTTVLRDEPKEGTKILHSELFDSVVVASGHYHASRVPSIPGLKEWKSAWPSQVQHSKSYRHPETFANQTVLLIGAGTSSTDIARESVPLGKMIYQSSRGGLFDVPPSFLPPRLIRVGGVASFSPVESGKRDVTLVDGTILHDIDRVVPCTGYHFSLPFLPALHSDLTPPDAADEKLLVSDGTMLHNLHKDIFYIPDPSLAFVGVPFFTATFTLFEFQAIAVAAVFSGRAWVPSEQDMRVEYEERLKAKGVGKMFHSLRETEVEYVDSLVEWVNRDAEVSGGKRLQSHDEAWRAEEKLKFLKMRAFFVEKAEAAEKERAGRVNRDGRVEVSAV